MVAVAWGCYSAPIHLANRLRSAVEQPRESAASSLISSRVDFAKVNAQLSGDLHSATRGQLDYESFSQLLLRGWLPQQRPKADIEASVPAQHTRLYRIRYQDLNRFIAIYWDPNQIHEVVLTLQRQSVLHRWYVTRVHQFNVCAYDFDCALLPSAEAAKIKEPDLATGALYFLEIREQMAEHVHFEATGPATAEQWLAELGRPRVETCGKR
jgi:hypothetical protein